MEVANKCLNETTEVVGDIQCAHGEETRRKSFTKDTTSSLLDESSPPPCADCLYFPLRPGEDAVAGRSSKNMLPSGFIYETSSSLEKTAGDCGLRATDSEIVTESFDQPA